MFAVDDSQSLTLEELTWLSASALIENQHALSESPSPDRDSRALFNTVFSDSHSEFDLERDEDDEESPSPSRRDSPSLNMSEPRPRARALGTSGSGSPTPSTVGSSVSQPGPSGISAPLTPSPSPLLPQSSSSSLFQPGRQPITPPPTPPRRHLRPPRYLSPSSSSQLINEPYGSHVIGGVGTLTPPSPSPSVSSSTLSSTLSSRQTEWIYRRPKAVNPSGLQGINGTGSNVSIGNTLLSRHRSASINAGQSASATASCSSRQVSRSPSIASSSFRTTPAATCDDPHSATTTVISASTSSVPLSNGSGSSSTSSSTRRSSKLKHHAASGSAHATKPRPSSPTLISSTTQLVDVGSPPVSPSGMERSSSVCSNVTSRSYNNDHSRRCGVKGSGGLVRSPTLNGSVSSLQLQSSIRVSPLKNRHGRAGGGSGNGGGGGGGGGGNPPMVTSSGSDATIDVVAANQVAEPQPPTTTASALAGTPTVLERSLSNASTTTNRSVGKPIWSALRGGYVGATVKSSASISPSTATMGAVFATRNPERNRILKLKSIPSQTQISIDSSVTPTFVTPPPAASLPLFTPSNLSSSYNAKDANEKLLPKTPTRIRHSLSAASTTTTGSSSLPQQQKDKDRPFQRRDKFASAPPLPVPFVGGTTRSVISKVALTSVSMNTDVGGDASSTPNPALPHSGTKMSPSLLSPSSLPASRLAAENRSRRRKSSSSSNTNQNSSGRDRTSSFASQTSVATATTAQTSATSSSCSTTSSFVNSQCNAITPTTAPSFVPVPQVPGDPASKPLPVPGAYNFRCSSSNSTSYTPPSCHLHGHDGEKKPPSLLNYHQPYQHRHQRQSSTSSSVSFSGIDSGLGGGNTAAASARSQAYAQLTGTAIAAGIGLGATANANANLSSRQRRPSTSPGSGPGSETSSIHSHIHLSPYGQRHGQGGAIGSIANGSASTLMPSSSSPSTHQHHPRAAHSSLVSLSHYGNPSPVTRTPSRITSPPYVPSHHFSSLPKSKSILTRTSSLSTKASACGGTVKSVKFVEIPEVYYRSGYYEHDGNEFIYGCDSGSVDEEEDEDEDDIPAVGARGEGQEGMVLRECSGMDIEAIDMDIDTYLGTHRPLAEEGEKESKYSFKKMGWGFLSRGRKVEKENRREEDESKDSITPPLFEREQKKEEKEKTTSGFGLRKLMGLTTRKAPPPPLSLSISSPAPLSPKSPTTFMQAEEKIQERSKKRSTSPPVSPRKPISGPYVLGSHLPSRSPPSHSPMPSPSSSFLHQPASSRPIPSSSSNTSLNKMHGGRQHGHQNPQTLYAASQGGGSHHRSRSLRSTHQTNTSLSTVTNLGMNTGRPVGPNVAGTRPKGLVIGADSLLSVNAVNAVNAVPVPLKNAPSYESFRSAKSYGGRSARSDVGSMRSARSAGAGSMRSFRTWMNKVGTSVNGGRSGTGVAVAVAE